MGSIRQFACTPRRNCGSHACAPRRIASAVAFLTSEKAYRKLLWCCCSDEEIRRVPFAEWDAPLIYARERGFDTREDLVRRVNLLGSATNAEATEPFLAAFRALEPGTLADGGPMRALRTSKLCSTPVRTRMNLTIAAPLNQAGPLSLSPEGSDQRRLYSGAHPLSKVTIIPCGIALGLATQARSLHQKVIALREIHGFTRRRAVISGRCGRIASHFQQMCANGIHPVVFSNSPVRT
jgi:hypothetical protein